MRRLDESHKVYDAVYAQHGKRKNSLMSKAHANKLNNPPSFLLSPLYNPMYSEFLPANHVPDCSNDLLDANGDKLSERY